MFFRKAVLTFALASVSGVAGIIPNEDSAINRVTSEIERLRAQKETSRLAEAYAGRSMIYFAKGAYRDTVTDLKKAIELDPKKSAYHNNLAFALYEIGLTDRAIVEWRDVLRLSADRVETTDSRAGLAIAFYEQGGLVQAIASYRIALAAEPRYASLAWMRSDRFWTEKSLRAAAGLFQAGKLSQSK